MSTHGDDPVATPARRPRAAATKISPMDIGIALAMSRNGFSEAQIVSVLGYMPDLAITPEELEAAVPPLPGG